MNNLAHLSHRPTPQSPVARLPRQCWSLLWFWDIGKISLILIGWRFDLCRLARRVTRGTCGRGAGSTGQSRKARCHSSLHNCKHKPPRLVQGYHVCNHAHSKSFRVGRAFSVWHPLQTPAKCLGDADANAIPQREIAFPPRRQA